MHAHLYFPRICTGAGYDKRRNVHIYTVSTSSGSVKVPTNGVPFFIYFQWHFRPTVIPLALAFFSSLYYLGISVYYCPCCMPTPFFIPPILMNGNFNPNASLVPTNREIMSAKEHCSNARWPSLQVRFLTQLGDEVVNLNVPPIAPGLQTSFVSPFPAIQYFKTWLQLAPPRALSSPILYHNQYFLPLLTTSTPRSNRDSITLGAELNATHLSNNPCDLNFDLTPYM